METSSLLKGDLRNSALAKRNAIPLPVRKIKDAAIRERLKGLEEFQSAKSVMFYASARTEVDTIALIEDALGDGKRVFLPRVAEDGLGIEIYEIRGLNELSPRFMDIPEPPAIAERRRGLKDAEVVIVPGAAFDASGYRVGYGRGCYDRMLGASEHKPALVGLAYEEQLVPEVPAEPHDVAIDIIITDRRTVECSGQG